MKTKKEAIQAAKELISKMRTKGWEPIVWESISWHFSIRNKNMNISPSCCGSYFALLGSDEYPNAGRPEWTTNKSFEDPNDAFEHQLTIAQNFVNEVCKTVTDLEEVAESSKVKIKIGPSVGFDGEPYGHVNKKWVKSLYGNVVLGERHGLNYYNVDGRLIHIYNCTEVN